MSTWLDLHFKINQGLAATPKPQKLETHYMFYIKFVGLLNYSVNSLDRFMLYNCKDIEIISIVVCKALLGAECYNFWSKSVSKVYFIYRKYFYQILSHKKCIGPTFQM